MRTAWGSENWSLNCFHSLKLGALDVDDFTLSINQTSNEDIHISIYDDDEHGRR